MKQFIQFILSYIHAFKEVWAESHSMDKILLILFIIFIVFLGPILDSM